MPANTNEFTADLHRFHRALAGWYKRHGRRLLPWRNTRDPYHIYISEVMLQQTQVKTVLERYYPPFLKLFPTLRSLAEATQQEVVKQWEGLGYYTRARNLHAAAQQAGGILPDTVEGLLALPGIGRNTAHAIACFGFGAAVPVMEANVRRVLCRIFAMKIADEKQLWEKAELLLNRKDAFHYNQAMMDIGATVCTPRSPRCAECPANILCKGQTSPESYPAAKIKKTVPVRKRTIVAFRDTDGRYVLMRRETRFLGGLYGFPDYDEAAASVEWGGKPYHLSRGHLLGAITQTYSHFQLQAKVYRVPLKGRVLPSATTVLANPAEMARLPLSRADHKIMHLLEEFKWRG